MGTQIGDSISWRDTVDALRLPTGKREGKKAGKHTPARLCSLPVEEPCDRTPFRQFSSCVVRGHFRIVPTTGSLHIDERRSGLCQGDRGADTQGVS